MRSIENDKELILKNNNPFETETALYQKEYVRGDIVAMVSVPDFYHVALPNIGHQIIERQINQISGFFAYRCYLNRDYSLLREVPNSPDLIFISMSYEGSYIRAVRILDLLGISPFARKRSGADPLIVIGGRAVSINPLPLFEIADIIGIGDGDELVRQICLAYKSVKGDKILLADELVIQKGTIVTSRYEVVTKEGYLERWEAKQAPSEILPNRGNSFPHSWYLSSETDYNEIGYYEKKTFFSMEIVKACASKCLFCAAGFSDGQVRFTEDGENIVKLGMWSKGQGADLIKLFFPANSSVETTKSILRSLLNAGLVARVGSAKAERIDEEYVELVGRAGQEKFAIAPETGDYNLRAMLGKPGMTDEVLREVVKNVINSGIPNLDFYFIMNLPGEKPDSFTKTLDFIEKFLHLTNLAGLKERFRISYPNFFPKAWTPFQYAAFGSIEEYTKRIDFLERYFGETIKISNMKNNVDLLSQNIMSRGGIEAGQLLIEVYRLLKMKEVVSGKFQPDGFEDWRSAMMGLGISESQYFTEKSTDRALPWHHIQMYPSVNKLIKAWSVFGKKCS